MIRVPVGFALLAGAGAIAAIILAYMGGYQHAESTLRQEYEERTLGADGLFNPGEGGFTDPMNAGGSDAAGGESGSGETAVPPRSGPGSRGWAENGAGDGTGDDGAGDDGADRRGEWAGRPGWGPLESDPRRSGRNYLMLLQGDNVDEALKVATFCREQGLEAYVLIGDNGRFARVIANPGFESASSAEAVALRERALEVGRRLQADRVSSSDLHDCYYSLYTG